MYESFGMRERPFRPIADPECYYPATGHEAVLAQLLLGIQEDEALLLLTGDPGVGKTILCHCLLDRLGESVASVFLTHSHFGGRSGLLQAILYDLGLPHESRSEQELRLALTGYLLKNYEAGRRTVVIIDEAQNLTLDLLEEIRLFTNLEGKSGKALQALLVGQPALLQMLELRDAAVINQRALVRGRLEPFGAYEAADYLYHQVRQAGGKPDEIFAEEAVDVAVRSAGGNPRLLNRVASLAFTIAHNAGSKVLDVEAVLEALSRLGLEETATEADAGIEAEGDASELSADENPVPVLSLEEESAPLREEATVPDVPRQRRVFLPPRRPA
jgi:type II secretory pathway predicted ATPase ExeA